MCRKKQNNKIMKLFILPLLIALGCEAAKPNQADTHTDINSAKVAQEKVFMDTINSPEGNIVALPKCIKHKLDYFKLKAAHERPQAVKEYVYNGKKVYYVVMPCCDFFNEVYDEHCKYLGAPDGGFTGKGDGKLPDFIKEKKKKKLIWGPVK